MKKFEAYNIERPQRLLYTIYATTLAKAKDAMRDLDIDLTDLEFEFIDFSTRTTLKVYHHE